MKSAWKLSAFSVATTLAVAYVLCAIFDAIFPPFGFLAAIAHASPWPITGSLAGTAVGLSLFSAIGFALGAIYGAASEFWSKRLR